MSQTCSHIYDTGGICKSFAVRGQRYCVNHLRYRARRLRMAQARARGQRFEFNLPPLESMHAVQSAISQLAEAIACGVSVLRVASSNLRHPEKWQDSLYHSDQPAPDVDVAAEYGLPADLDLDTAPDVAFPRLTNPGGPQLPGAPPLSAAPADDRVGFTTGHQPSATDHLSQLPGAPPLSAASADDRVGFTTGHQPPATDHLSQLPGAPPLSAASADDRVGFTTGHQPPATDHLSQLPFSGNYCGYHHSRECECCRIRSDYPVTPESVEVVELHQKYGDDLAGVRSSQLERNRKNRELRKERKRYEAIALERNLLRAVEVLTERKLKEGVAPKPPARASDPNPSSDQMSQKSALSPTGSNT